LNVLVLLIFASLAIATTFLIGFIWAVRSGQYEDTFTPSMRVLIDDAAPAACSDGPPQLPSRSKAETKSARGDSDSSPMPGLAAKRDDNSAAAEGHPSPEFFIRNDSTHP